MTRGPSLVARAAVGLGWVLGSLAAARGLALASNVVLARILSPSEFGLVAVPLMVIVYLETVGDIGTGAALVQVRENRDEAALVTLVFNLVMGVGWYGAMRLLAQPAAALLGHPEAGEAMRVLAWVLPIKSLGNTQEALMLHDLDFRRRTVPEVGRAATKAGVSVALAFTGHGVWSLVWGQVIGEAAWVVMTWTLVPWRPWRHVSAASRAIARKMAPAMLSFGSQVVMVNVLAAVLHHVDDLLVAGVAGVVAVGVYTQVSKLPDVAVTTLTWAVGKVAFSAFARSQGDDTARRQVYLAGLRWVSAFTLPAAALMCAMPGALVVTAFGRQWTTGGPLLPWLALGAAFRAVGSHAGDLFKGAGRADLLRNLALIKACITLPALGLACLSRQPVVIAASLAAATLVTSALNIHVARRLLSLASTDILREIAPAAAAALVAATSALAIGPLVASWPLVVGTTARGVLGVLAGAATLWWLSPDLRLAAQHVLGLETEASPSGAAP